MNLLVLAPSYPYDSHPFAGIFNERCVLALHPLCKIIEVLSPRPYAPPFLSSLVSRWKAYSRITSHEFRHGVPIFRPVYPVIPAIGSALWADWGRYRFCRRVCEIRHAISQYDALVSFDLMGSGGMAWRLGRHLGIPAVGWATGDDIRVPARSSFGRSIVRSLRRLDLVFYQSRELFNKAAELLDVSPERLSADRHVVLSRGIPLPPKIHWEKTRAVVRAKLRLTTNNILVLSVGRIVRDKGVYELLEAMREVAASNKKVYCVVVGSKPEFDETGVFLKRLKAFPELSSRFEVLPACSPDEVWSYLCAADLFAFPSHKEGMPNSLLEALAMGVPAVSFAIPPVQEIQLGTGAVALVPPFDTVGFARVVLQLAADPEMRNRLGALGQQVVAARYDVRKNMGQAFGRLSHLVAARTSGRTHGRVRLPSAILR